MLEHFVKWSSVLVRRDIDTECGCVQPRGLNRGCALEDMKMRLMFSIHQVVWILFESGTVWYRGSNHLLKCGNLAIAVPDVKSLLESPCTGTAVLEKKQSRAIKGSPPVEGKGSGTTDSCTSTSSCTPTLVFVLVPTLEEYTHLLRIPVSDKVTFSGLEEIPISHVIAEAFHLKESESDAHLVKKGGILGLTFEFLIGKAIVFAQAGSMDAFESIFVLLIYGLALFPDIDGFVDINSIRIFLIGNVVPTLLGDMYFSLHLRSSKGSLDIIDNCGEFSNVPLIGTQRGINYNLALAHRQLGFPLRDKPNNTQLEGLFYQEGKDPQLLKKRMIHAWHNVHRKGRSELGPRNCVALEAYTIWELEDALVKMKQKRDMWEERFHALSRKHEELQLESKDKDALIEILEDRAMKRQREPEGLSSSSMPHPSGAWKKIVDQLVL
ncbi:hypothetical protein KIW84_063950 [Lathyrus oleraceus]|uniref:DUF7745 domain-containing protein n=1 Tax=Pisum sativum TaxID=3888 RepID=A0A9D4W8Y1_PEA|nr:hypothetical protein KIW84_063950 [Pisum sativum]